MPSHSWGPGDSYSPGPHTYVPGGPPSGTGVGHAGAMDDGDGLRVREAVPADAFSVAALHIQDERERGGTVAPGFLDAFADAWLRDRARRTWIAEDARGRPLGVVHGTRVQKLPSAHRPAVAWFHVSLLYVAADVRGHGLGERLLRSLLEWAARDGVSRVQLNAVPLARTLYARVGFGPPSDRLMELRLGPTDEG